MNPLNAIKAHSWDSDPLMLRPFSAEGESKNGLSHVGGEQVKNKRMILTGNVDHPTHPAYLPKLYHLQMSSSQPTHGAFLSVTRCIELLKERAEQEDCWPVVSAWEPRDQQIRPWLW